MIDDVEVDVDLQAEPSGSPISPVIKKSDEISAGRTPKKARQLDFGGSQSVRSDRLTFKVLYLVLVIHFCLTDICY